jgi:hypothetical protein
MAPMVHIMPLGYMKGFLIEGGFNNHRKGKLNLYGDYSFREFQINRHIFYVVMKNDTAIDNYLNTDRMRQNGRIQIGLVMASKKQSSALYLQVMTFADMMRKTTATFSSIKIRYRYCNHQSRITPFVNMALTNGQHNFSVDDKLN